MASLSHHTAHFLVVVVVMVVVVITILEEGLPFAMPSPPSTVGVSEGAKASGEPLDPALDRDLCHIVSGMEQGRRNSQQTPYVSDEYGLFF